MGIETPTGDAHELEELDRLIEGRWALINRLFQDVEELIDERDRLAGRDAGFLVRLFGRRRQAPAPTAMTKVRRPEVRRPSNAKPAYSSRHSTGPHKRKPLQYRYTKVSTV